MITSNTIQHLRNPDPKLWRDVKVSAVTEGVTMTAWVEDACRKKLAASKKKESDK